GPQIGGERFDAQQWRDYHIVFARAQLCRSPCSVGLGPSDEKPHGSDRRQEVCAGELLEFAAGGSTDSSGIADITFTPRFEEFAAVRLRDQSTKINAVGVDSRVAGNRGATGTFKFRKESALDDKRRARVTVS